MDDTDNEGGYAGDLPSDDEDLNGLPRVQLPTKGRRLWDSSIIYPNGVKNWCHLPNILAAFDYGLPRVQLPTKGRRLWDSSIIYPNGVKNWCHLPNILAAFDYECPCDRRCLARIRARHGDAAGHVLCMHRQSVRAKAKELGQGGLRDHMASAYTSHYNKVNKVFTQSFVVGDVGDVCERAFAVACGLSEVTYVRASTARRHR
mmetsp:Transcript_25183/g.79498  ORF Transcript_25183/g.79498 Transcript_25183/m.79498 type:complete len:203 (-) Transcript_25183:739-1347(-)